MAVRPFAAALLLLAALAASSAASVVTRPGRYFGTRTETDVGVLAGFAWFVGYDASMIRDECNNDDRLGHWGWRRNDGAQFGEHELIDGNNNIRLKFEWVKHGGAGSGNWTLRVTGSEWESFRSAPQNVSLLFYTAVEDEDSEDGLLKLRGVRSGRQRKAGLTGDVVVSGQSEQIGSFQAILPQAYAGQPPREGVLTPSSKLSGVRVKDDSLGKTQFTTLSLNADSVWNWRDAIQSDMHDSFEALLEKLRKLRERKGDERFLPFIVNQLNGVATKGDANVVVLQRTLTVPFTQDFMFVRVSKPLSTRALLKACASMHGDALTETLRTSAAAFDAQFEQRFQLAAKGFTQQQRTFAASVFSNLIGGVTYFHGRTMVDDADSAVGYTLRHPVTLRTAVPSRSFFPRGFLWDEGFHQLVISHWNASLSMAVIDSWFDTMDDDGWMPREQILGGEALARVPDKFQIQKPDVANPPALLLAVEQLLRLGGVEGQAAADGTAHAHAAASSTSPDQVTAFVKRLLPRALRWFAWLKREQAGAVPNSFRWRGRSRDHNLPSGLDDYPRPSLPSDVEQNVDLLSWMAMSARVLSRVARAAGQRATARKLEEEAADYVDELDSYWDSKAGVYADIGLNNEHELPHRVVHVGYVSLFPLLLGLEDESSPRIGKLLAVMRDSKHLWSAAGLRSLSKSDLYYGRGENYWRGKVWINMNYLALRALWRLSHGGGRWASEAGELYSQLRQTVVDNIFKHWETSGAVWENYKSSGRYEGTGSRPFTGWTSCVVLMMAEMY